MKLIKPNVNSSKYREQASTINLLINKLVNIFPKVAFIAMATPYANILINPQAKDLYPKDFITALKRPSKYFGQKDYLAEIYQRTKMIVP